MTAKNVYIFPGQGAQIIGMGKDFYDTEICAKDIFNTANELLGYDLADICFNGPEDKLNSTVISQPAIFTTSAAILAVLKEKKLIPEADLTAGLSLGEYTALYASGAVSFEDGLKLVQKRGQAMQDAADASQGSMVSIMGLDQEKTQALCDDAAEGQILSCANFNCPGQIVITGEIAPCKRACEMAEKYGAIKAIELKVAGAFHSKLMAPAAEALAAALAGTTINTPAVKVISNSSAEYYTNATSISDGLVKQLTGTVLWQKCMEKIIADGGEHFYEIGPNRVLTGLMKRIKRKANIANISTVDAMAKLNK